MDNSSIDTGVAFLIGLLIGSFLNVCIYRLPRNLSVVRPRSFCPHCGKTIGASENIPVFSYLLLRGRCRGCSARIPIRYPLVELATAIFFAASTAMYGQSWITLRNCTLGALLIALTVTDFETLLLPELLTVPGIALGLIFSFIVPPQPTFFEVFGVHGRGAAILKSITGVLIPALPLFVLGWIFEKVRHKQGLGFGDVMMIAAVGAFLGPSGALLTLVLASIAGSVLGIAYILWAHKDPGKYELPLGSFIGIAGIVVTLWGEKIAGWYTRSWQG